MKNIKAGFGAALSLLFVGALLFSACANIFISPKEPEETRQEGVTISIAGEPAIRTLYPTAEFTKYVLQFSHDTASHADVTLENGATSVALTDLADGTWTITAKGYVKIDIDDDPDLGPIEFEAARSSGTDTVTVTGGTAAEALTIELDAEMGSADGYVSWDINIPGEGIQEAFLEISPLSISHNPSGVFQDLLTPANRQGVQQLPAGYYLVRLWVYNGYQRIGHTEVAAVYSNMETRATYAFTGTDFVPAVKMSGTVALTNTSGVTSIGVLARKDNGEYYQQSVTVSGDGPYPWEMYAAASGTPSQISFDVSIYYSDFTSISINTGETITLSSSDVSNIDFTVNAAAITIGGTIHFTGITETPDSINFFYGNGRYQGPVALGTVSNGEADGTWSMKLPADLAGNEANFALLIQIGEITIPRSLGTITIPSTNGTISFDPVDLATVTWSGTIGLTVNGAFPSGDVSISAMVADDSGFLWSSVGSGRVNSDGTWSITVTNPYSDTKQVAFHVYFNNRGMDIEQMTLPGTAQSGISLGSYSYITLSGSVAVTMNGNLITSGSGYNINVNARSQMPGPQLGDAYVDPSGDWSMIVEPPASPSDLYFSVSVFDQINGISFGKDTGVSQSVSNSPITDIALGTVDFATVTWSGTIGLTVDGTFPSGDVGISAYEALGGSGVGSGRVNSDGTWSITVTNPYSDSKQIAFHLYFNNRGMNIEEMTLPGTAQTNITLGTYSYITLSGSVAVTMNGNPITSGSGGYNITVNARSQTDGSQLGVTVDPLGAWFMIVESAASPSDLYFSVSVFDQINGRSFWKDTGIFRSVSNSPIPGINLGTVAFATVTWSGTIGLTVNGAFPSGDVSISASAYEVPGGLWDGPITMIGSGQVNSDGTWSITVTNPYSGTKQVAFNLYFNNRGMDIERMTLPGTAQSGISLGSYSYITLSGSVAVTMNGTLVTSDSGYGISVNARSQTDGPQLGSANVDPLGNWSMIVESSPSPRTVYFDVHVGSQSGSLQKETGVFRSVSNSAIADIALGTYNYITLSGSVEVSLNGNPITSGSGYSININASATGGAYHGGNAYVDPSGAWSMIVEPVASPSDLYFSVSVFDQINGRSFWKDTGIFRSVSNSPITDIALGTVAFITLSGTVSGTVDGNIPEDCMVAAYIAGENKILGTTDELSNGMWSIDVEPQSSSKTVSFIVAPLVDNSTILFHLPSEYNRTVYDTDLNGIALTGLAFATKTIEVNITSNGTTPVPGQVYICNSPIVQTDLSNQDAMWFKVIAMPASIMTRPNWSEPLPSTWYWSLKVPSDTGDVYYLVVTESQEVYVSASAVSSSATPVTLNLSTMTELEFGSSAPVNN